MALLANDKGGSGDFEPIPMGTHIARCVTVVDLGVQHTPWGNKEKVYLGFELPGVRVEWEKDGTKHEGPALLGSQYTLSIHPKSILGQHLVSWRGLDFTDEERKGFDVFAVLGGTCMISVTHTVKGTKTYANIAAIMRAPHGTSVPDLEGELIGYTAMDPKYSGTLDKLPEWLRKKAEEGSRMSPVEPAAPAAAPPPLPPLDDSDFDEEIPF